MESADTITPEMDSTSFWFSMITTMNWITAKAQSYIGYGSNR